MQRLFHWTPSEGRLLERPIAELDTALAEDGWVWLDVSHPSADEVHALGHRFSIDALSIDDVLDVTLLPKVDHHDDYVFVVLHGVVAGRGRRLTTSELDMFIGPRFLLTVHAEDLGSIEWAVAHGDGSGDWTDSPARFAAAVAKASSRRYLQLLGALEERIEDLENDAIVGDPSVLTESHALRRDVILLRRVIGPQREVLRSLTAPVPTLIDERAARAFGDVYDLVFQVVESVDASRALIGSVVEAYRGAVAERTNEVMQVLTVFSAIMLPLGLIAGIWGMNFADVPGAGWRWGFIVLLGVMTLIAVGLWAYFARRGFIGGPKLLEIPKAVGLGLVHLGTAPLRVVGRTLRPQDPVIGHDQDAEGDDDGP